MIRTPEALLADAGDLTEVGTLEEARPQQPREVGIYHQGNWWKLVLPEPETDSPVGLLDVELLRTNVIRDLLGIDELQPDSGADYAPAPNGIDEVVRRCDEDGRIGFVMYATSIEELMAVADAEELMPPKSSDVAEAPLRDLPSCSARAQPATSTRAERRRRQLPQRPGLTPGQGSGEGTLHALR